jgi:cardiolipin synthase (CMP-forming)
MVVENKWTIPNLLSAYRLSISPLILILILQGYEKAFVVLFIINQITDILDGYLARRWKQESEFGSRLDSYADIGSFILAFAGIIKFHSELFNQPYATWLIIFVTLYLCQMCIAKIKYGRVVAGLHLYSSKLTGYLQGLFLVLLFAWKLSELFFYVMIVIAICSELEVITINLISSRPIVNAKGLYWVYKEKRLVHE